MALAGTPPAAAAESPTDEPRWGWKTFLSFGRPGGDYGKTLQDHQAVELEVFRTSPKRGWRYGLGVSFSSFALKPPYADEPETALQQVFLTGTRIFRSGQSLRPYLEARAGLARLHPRSDLFDMHPLPPDFAIGDSPTPPANGFGLTLFPGLELRLSRTLALDAAVGLTYFKTNEYDLSPIGAPPAGSGTIVSGRFGLVWRPVDDKTPEGTRVARARNGWGVGRNYGWAAGEMLSINTFSSAFNEYVRNANFNQISPRSWWSNLQEGFTYDDNEFRTNQLSHPINGSMYFTSARGNGLNYWVSSGYATVGAFLWECCGETHPMSINDLIATSFGGMAIGEIQFRLSSKLLDNTTTGKGRFWRELGAFFISPVRGLNRFVSGRHSSDTENPEDPMDWRPPHAASYVAVGVRVIGEGSSITNDTKTYPFFEFDHNYGSVFDNLRRKPFDSFDVGLQLNFGEKVPLGRIEIRGDLWSKALGDAPSPRHALSIVHHFDYINNTAYEFGGQSFGPSLRSRFRLSDSLSLSTRVDGIALLLGGINSQYAKIADVADRERLREYDYGPGLGAAAAVSLFRKQHPLVQLVYRFQWVSVTNGSIYTKGSEGSSADHYIQAGGIRVKVPVYHGFGLGADAFVFKRDSYYSIPAFKDTQQRNPQARLYLVWNGSH